MSIALVTGNITASGGSSAVGGIAVTVSPTMTSGQYLTVIVACGGACNISGTNLEVVGSITQQGSTTTICEFSLLRATGNVTSFVANISTATLGISAAAAVWSATNRLRIDTSQTGTATSASIATASAATTAQANELWIGGTCSRSSGGPTFSVAKIAGTNADNTYQNTSTIGATTDRGVALWYRSVSATGTPNATITASTSGIYAAQIVCLEETPASGASGGGLRTAGHGGLAA